MKKKQRIKEKFLLESNNLKQEKISIEPIYLKRNME